jgi:hypothetical protein
MKSVRYSIFILIALSPWHCRDFGDVPLATKGISSDGELTKIILREQPYSTYRAFPDAEEIVSGRLDGSNAHQPLVRVSMNETAFGALVTGKLPDGATFRDGSVIVKEIVEGGRTSLLAVMYRDRLNPLAGEGWLWAEYKPDGTVMVSLHDRGAGCTACHSRAQGPLHDLVRTFERQEEPLR